MIDLTPLYVKQAELDQRIADNHHVSYETTRERRILALLVEIGEFANATRCFKYWSNKPSEAQDIVLDEYVDGADEPGIRVIVRRSCLASEVGIYRLIVTHESHQSGTGAAHAALQQLLYEEG